MLRQEIQELRREQKEMAAAIGRPLAASTEAHPPMQNPHVAIRAGSTFGRRLAWR